MKFQLEKQKPDPLLHMNKKGDISPLYNMIWWKKVVLDRQGHKDLEKSAKHMNNLSPQLPNVTAHVN